MRLRLKTLHQLWSFVRARFGSSSDESRVSTEKTAHIPFQPITSPEHAHCDMWLTALDQWQRQIVLCREWILSQDRAALEDPEALQKKQTQLSDMDVRVRRLREYFMNYRYRLAQFKNQSAIMENPEFAQANNSGVILYFLIAELNTFMGKTPLEKPFPDALSVIGDSIDAETESLRRHLSALNRFVYRQEALMQIAELEKSLLCSLSRNEIMIIPNTFDQQYPAKMAVSLEVNQRDWTYRTNQISDEVHASFVRSLIHIYHLLSSCYIVNRRTVIKSTFDNIAESISEILAAFIKKPIEQDEVLFRLRCMYNDIESLRFSANQDGRCSRNLLDKSKTARKLFRRACGHDPIGQTLLKELVKPASVFKVRR